jgi:hypothetical protein
MKMQEFVRLAMERDPRGLGKLPEKKATAAVRGVLGAISAQIDEAVDGTAVRIPMVGAFRVRIKAAEGDTPEKRKVGFRRLAARAKREGKGKGKGRGKGTAARATEADAESGE